ncbi:hypothetical protein ACH46_15705 [Gordonia phthalatica]|uniref:Histidine kinase/HSP90-like ATPase domain-containing protein n=2 Tax=Gordonia phthalatica TaxID=1136941 RepID=A0A0N9NET1_9ACTN|nr:hypothetical protein ACH46_15705 [Gordonia phthalatica]
MARFVGAGFLAYLLTSIPMFGRPAGLVADWFTPIGMAAAYGPGLVLLIISFIPGYHRMIPTVAVSCTVGYLAACGLWFLAWNGWEADTEYVTWLMSFSGLPSLAWVLVRPAREAVAVLVACAGLAALITDTGRADTITSNVLIESLWGIVFTLSFMLASGRVVRTGRLLDETRADAVQAAGRTAAVAARNTERARFDALIHDHVIATLVAAYSNPDEARLPQQAAHALGELQTLATGADADADVGGAEALGRLRAVVTAVDPDITVVTRRDDVADVDVKYPAVVVRALAEAVGEAVRNSVGHAGPDAECAVLVEIGTDVLRVTVADDGIGFDLDSVPPERLGIEVSIRQRLRELPGAQTRLRSAPGEGTTVQMAWERC